MLLSLQKQKAEAELVALKAQMNPHFIFNTLNSINWYVLNNNPKSASQYLTKFSKIMRLILENSKKELISLTKELETLQIFVDLESIRFTNKFDYSVHVDPSVDLYNTYIPPLIFQPFVENSIWHGLLHKEGKGEVRLNITKKGNQIICTIEDDGAGRNNKFNPILNKDKESSGIAITKKRISGLPNGLKHPIKIIDLKDDQGQALGTKVILSLPIIRMQ